MAKNASWEGKTRGGVAGYRAFIFLLRHAGIRFAYFILIWVAFYFVFFAPKASKASYFYFRKIWNYSIPRSLFLVYKSYYKFGQTLLDKIALLAGVKTNFTFHHEGGEHLGNLAKANTGALLISGHVGNWEIAGHLMKRFDVPVNVVMYDAEFERIKSLLQHVMTKKKYQTIVIKDDFSHLIQLHKAFKNNEFICLHGDRFVKANANKVRSIPFLGKAAKFPNGPFELAARFKVPYAFVFTAKASNTHYHFFATTGSGEKNNAETIQKEYVQALEKFLQKYPEQWFNYYDFWASEN